MRALFTYLAALLPASVPATQQPIKTYNGYLDWVYWNIDFVGDLDGDGFGEILLAEGFDAKVIVLSSSSGLQLFSFTGSSPSGIVTNRVTALGDVDGDAVEDFGVCFGTLAKCLVWSGSSKAVILDESEPYASMTGVGDLNGDDFADVLLGEIGGPSFPGSATVYHGPSLSQGYTVHDQSALGGGFGRVGAGLGDVDGDGRDDFAVAAPSNGSPGDCPPGVVDVFSGVDGRRLYELVGETVNDVFGVDLVVLDDITGDGVSDLVVGASGADDKEICKQGGPGRVYFYDGASGALLDKLDPEYPMWWFGVIMEAVGDLDGNGYSDLLARVLGVDDNDTEVWAIDGKTRERIYTIASPFPDALTYNFAPMLAGTGDWDGDDFPDFLLGSPNGSVAGFGGAPGKLDLYSGAPLGVAAFGAPCPLASGSLPRIGATGSPAIGTNYALHLSQVEPGLDVFLAIGVSSSTWLGVPLPINLAVVGMPGCELLISLTKVFAAQTVEVTPGLGAATFTLLIPDQPALIGAKAFAQGFIANPPGSATLGATTRGLQLTLH